MSDFLHQWLTATQYIAPLMANFDTRIGNESSRILYADTGSTPPLLNLNSHHLATFLTIIPTELKSCLNEQIDGFFTVLRVCFSSFLGEVFYVWWEEVQLHDEPDRECLSISGLVIVCQLIIYDLHFVYLQQLLDN